MVKKIMILCSSPHKDGKTNTMANWCVQGAADAGAQVECIDVANLKYKNNGCIACYGCQQSEKYECVVPDDASALLKRFHEFDALVFATPIYFFGPNAQLKLILDRMFSLVKINPETGEFTFQSPGRQMALISTSGGDMDDGIGQADQLFKMVAGFQGSKYSSLLAPNSPNDPQELVADADLKEKAIAFGRALAAD